MSWLTDVLRRMGRLIVRPVVISALIVVAGCAVAQIDVDVYKGPLVNDELVQIEQTAAMAIGAKPLLVALRDELQWPDENVRQRKEKNIWYKRGFVEDNRHRYFTNERAIEVNEVLGLYDDIDGGKVADLIDQAREAIGDMEQNARVLNEANQTMKNLADELRSPKVEESIKALPAATTERANKLKRQYIVFFETDPETHYRLAYDLVDAHKHFWQPLHAANKSYPNDIATTRNGTDYSKSTNGSYELLENPNFVSNDAALFFTDPTRRQLFVDAVTQIARAFGNCRNDQATIMADGLWIIKDVVSTVPSRANQHRLIRFAAPLVSTQIEIRYLCLALIADQKKEYARTLQSRLDDRLGDTWRTCIEQAREAARFPTATNEEKTAEYYKALAWLNEKGPAIQEVIEEILVEDPQTIAPALEQLDTQFALADGSKIPDWAAMQDPIAREYGITGGPTLRAIAIATSGIPLSLMAMSTSLSSLQSAITGALAGGRIRIGIETLIRNYSEATTRFAEGIGDQETVASRQEELLTQLTQFGEKLQFMANNQLLLEQGDSARYARAQKRDSKGNETPNESDHGAVVDPTSEPRMLQAVANSMITQIDELRRADQPHDARAEALEEQGLKAAGSQLAKRGSTSGPSMSSIAYGLNESNLTLRPTTMPLLGPSRTDVIDQLIDKLRYEYFRQIKYCGPDDPTAKNYKSALDFLNNERESMVFIRPPSAFLRNSSPVTSLQDSTSSTWHNMLMDQVWKSVPLLGSIGQNDRDIQTREEIDKTFWQTINRVRVAGGNTTNYVIVKDDIGNWYVKGFSADPKDMIQSAQALASAATGATVTSPAIEQALMGRGYKSPAAPPSPTADQNVLQNQYQATTRSYDVELADEYQAAVNAVITINGEVDAALSNSDAKNAGNGAFLTYLLNKGKDADKDMKSSTQPSDIQTKSSVSDAQKTISVLRAIKAYGEKLITTIYQATDGSPSRPQMDAAAKVVRDTVRNKINPLLGHDVQKVDEYYVQFQLIQSSESP